MTTRICLAGLLALVAGVRDLPSAHAGVASASVRETAEVVLRKFGREAAEEGSTQLVQRLERLAARYGDDALVAARKCGPRGLTLIEEAGEHGADDAVRLLARHGDAAARAISRPRQWRLVVRHGDAAAEALIRHGEIAEPVVRAFGRPAAGALRQISARNARRMAIQAESGALQRLGRADELLAVIEKYGDRAMDFVWRNKGALAVTAGLAAFLRNPEPFLDGVTNLAEVAGRHAVQPAIEAGGEIGTAAAARADWGRLLGISVAAIAATIWLKRFIWHGGR